MCSVCMAVVVERMCMIVEGRTWFVNGVSMVVR